MVNKVLCVSYSVIIQCLMPLVGRQKGHLI